MAKTLATVSGVALIPGVSKNGRWYTREAIAKAVTRAQGRIADGAQPLTMLTSHGADDDSTHIVGRVTSMTLEGGGTARFTADIADTPHGRTIASLVDTTSGEPFLKGVSLRGAWAGKVRRVKGPLGEPVETADDLEFDGIDYTRKPGVAAASVDAFSWAKDGATETSERVLITENVQEARVTAISEEAEPATGSAAPDGLREALGAVLPGTPHVLENGLCATCAGVSEAATNPMSKRDSGLSGKGGTAYADPGYQADKKQRYELDTAAHIRAAWAFISKAQNAKAYTAAQLKRIKGRIKAAAKKSGIQIAAEGWTAGPAFQVTEALAEWMGDPGCAGSYSLSATNGPTTVTVCSYGLDPADLSLILARACDAAGIALCALDPDMDGDIDVPGADAEDTDSDAGQMDNGDGTEDLVRRIMSAVRGESAEDPETLIEEARVTWTRDAPQVTEQAPASPAPEQAAADREGTEAPAVSETTTQEAVGTAPAAAYSQADLDAAVSKALDAAETARRARKAAKRAAAETAPAAAVTESDDERVSRLVEEKLAAVRAESGPTPVTETEDQRIARIVEERLVSERQAITASGGGPSRKGLVTEHSAARAADEGVPADFPLKDGEMVPMERWTTAQRRAVGDVLQRTYLGSKADIQ